MRDSPLDRPLERTIDEIVAEFDALHALTEQNRRKMSELTNQLAQRSGESEAARNRLRDDGWRF